MPDWLHDSFPKDHHIAVLVIAIRLAGAFVLGSVVAGIHRLTRGKAGSRSASLMGTLVLLSVLICMVTIVIGDNVARAFLLGALAIVRFRTVVEDTRDTGFVIFAVAVGMALGAGYYTVPLIGIPFAAVAAFVFRPRTADSGSRPLDFNLTVRIGAGHNPADVLSETFDRHLQYRRLTATATARQGAALDLTYAVRLRAEDAAIPLALELNKLEGVQNVEMRQS
jgi:uncharacterized membrane protein YhiD involved in acid resistance